MTAGFLDVCLGKSHRTLVDAGAAGLLDRNDHVAGGHRPEKLAGIPGNLCDQRYRVQSHDRGLELVGVLAVAHGLRLAGLSDLISVLLRTAGRHDRQAAGQQEVATVPVLDLDGVTGSAEVVDLSGQDQFHCCTPFSAVNAMST